MSVTVMQKLFFAALLLRQQMVEKPRLVGGDDVSIATLIEEDDNMHEDKSVLNEEDGVSRFEMGINVDSESTLLRKVREIRDILDNSVHHWFGKDPEVDAWVKEMGGLRQVDMLLVGRRAYRSYINNLHALKHTHGEIPSPLGQHTRVEADTATNYSGYAVEAHRRALIRKWHGEVVDIEETTEKDWRVDQYETDPMDANKPWWWKNRIFLGRFDDSKQRDKKYLAKQNHRFVQRETSSGRAWRLDLRISDTMCGFPYKNVYKAMPAWEVETNPVVKEFIRRFYNEPRTLIWQTTGTNDYTRWACGMATPKGKYLWSPLTYKSSKLVDFFKNLDEGKAPEQWEKRAFYYRNSVTVYGKSKKEDHIHVTKYVEDSQSGWLVVMREEDLHYTEWKKIRKQYEKLGAIDAYFGRPWKLYVVPEKKPDIREGYTEI